MPPTSEFPEPEPAASDLSAMFAEIAHALTPLARRSVTLAPFTTFRLGGPAAIMVNAESMDDLLRVRHVVNEHPDVDVLVIGQGSNLLIADAGLAGVVVVLGAGFSQINVLPAHHIRAGGAVKLPVLARRSAAAGCTGLEWAVGVPGSVGGGVRMNAGGHGSDMAASLVEAEIVHLRGPHGHERVAAADLRLAYRHSVLGSADVVASATFALRPGDIDASTAELAEIVRWRRAHQPGGANCGSVFTNPSGDSAGRLIDMAGCRGLRWGSAVVSPKHANFIQADDGGRAADVWALVLLVRERVFDRFGVLLHPEVRTAGFDATLPEHQRVVAHPPTSPLADTSEEA